MILLDTSVLIDLFRTKDKSKTFFYKLSTDYSDFAISSITHYEILLGSNSLQDKFWDTFFNSLTIIPFDVSCSFEAVKIYKSLKSKNNLIDIADITIAATAFAKKIKLATLNIKHFERINNLELIYK
ncbi:MAG: type II toxin-antitoxin system VapC family toxin [Bacteroidales bacterium]